MITTIRTERRGVLTGLLVLVLFLPLVGCDSPESLLARVVEDAPSAGRQQTERELRSLFDRKIITLDALMTESHDLLDAGEDATVFAGAVLDLAESLEDRLPKGPEHFLYWRRMGQLAYLAAYRAVELSRPDEAWTLVLSGPGHWQDGAYWRAYPNHDELASSLMAMFGDRREAMARLDRRADQGPEMEAMRSRVREIIRARGGR